MINYETPPISFDGSRPPKGRLTLQKTFIATGPIMSTGTEAVLLRFSCLPPLFTPGGARDASRTVQPQVAEVLQELNSNTYSVTLPELFPVSANTPDDIGGFFNFLSSVLGHWSTDFLDNLTLSIQAGIASDIGQPLGGDQDIRALFFLKNWPVDAGGNAIIYGHEAGFPIEVIHRNGFLINRAAYETLLLELPSGGVPNSTTPYPLYIISLLLDLSSGQPRLVSKITDDVRNRINNIMNGQERSPDGVVEAITAHFDALFDFPVTTADVKPLEVGGTFRITGADDVKLTSSDFELYDLSLEYSTLNEDGESELVDLHYDWAISDAEIKDNTVTFSFSANNLIVPAEAHEPLTVYVRGADGMELWSKEYRAGSAALHNMSISVARLGGSVKPGDMGAANPKRLRGQILDMTGQRVALNGTMVVVEGKVQGDTHWHVVGSALSDKDGYFSLPYPNGIYTAAQAIVSLMPHSPAAIAINANKGDNRTISDDFLYLLLKSVTVPLPTGEGTKDDCDCHNTLKATRLPDQADLIHSDEYTQDLGAGCINLSTPNRTLKEYSHQAVVRTSDPDVANYTLVRDTYGSFTLTGDKKKIRRKHIDLNNPIRWQDAPDTTGAMNTNPGEPSDNSHSNLSFYQAVTIATGHILHYKSMFKADGYSLGELLYSLPLAPGQKKQIVIFDSSHSLQGSESQQLSVSERLAANITNDRDVADQLSGSISEALRGRSSAETGGVAAAAGVAGSAGAVGGAVGVAGGYAMAGSNATQDSARNISQFFAEKLRNNVMQNADSYRQQNASVISTVNEGQKYSATTEVVANHNHCHSLTMMYFEVLRHYAIYQELTNVEECVFVPLLMTNFTRDNIFKWHDVLAWNLLPLPSNTYLPSIDGRHPLAGAFDAVERRKTGYANVEFPDGQFDQDSIRDIRGSLQIRVHLPRPKTKYDRIMSLPIVNKTVYHEEVDPEAIAKNIAMAPFTFGLSLFNKNTKTVAETIHVQAQLFDHFMTMDANFESVPPAQSIRVTNFQPVSLGQNVLDFFGLSSYLVSGENFFENGPLDRALWEAYARLLTYTGPNAVFDFLDYYFKGKLISEWDSIFYNDIAPVLYEKIVNTLTFSTSIDPAKRVAVKGFGLATTLTPLSRYNGGDTIMSLDVVVKTSKTREELGRDLYLVSDGSLAGFNAQANLILQYLNLNYSTDFYNGQLYSGYLGESILTGADMYMPITAAEKRHPKKEDQFLEIKLIEHLNSNLEYYNKVLWYNLDQDRRYMLLDGFNVQVYNDFGVPIGLKSLSSVIKNELITVAGNSLVFPVSPGFKISRTYLVEKTATGDTQRVELLDHYKPLTPPPPYRVSVPTKGLFVEAVKGMCDSCEKVEPNTSQDWNVFKADEPTAINALTAPTPTVTDWKATFKDIATATVGMQTAPTAPAVGAGLSGLSDALTKADTFKDVTGLAGNQANAASTYKANMDAATKMAEIAKGLATQEHNTDKSAQIMDKLKEAKDSGAISKDDYGKLVKQHLEQQIDGGSAAAKALAAAQKAGTTEPSLSGAAVNAANKGVGTVKATKTNSDGTSESVEISNAGAGSSGTGSGSGTGTSGSGGTNTTAPADGGNVLAKTDKPVPRIAQKDNVGCWGAAAAMMMSWKLGMPSKDKPGELIPMGIVDVVRTAGEKFVTLYTGTKDASPTGLPVSEKQRFLSALGMTSEDPKCYEPSFYIDLMTKYGPLWLTTDAIPDDPHLGLHARILTRITGTDKDASNIYFHFNDPAKPGEEQHLPYLQFQKEYDEAVKDTKSSSLFNQVFRFHDEKLWEQRTDWAKEAAEEKEALDTDIAAAIAEGYMVPDAENPAEGYKVAGPFNIPIKTAPVHETLTFAALRKSKFELPPDAAIPIYTSRGTNLDVNEFFRGVIWNDDPGCLLFEDDWLFNSDNMNYVTGAAWYSKYNYGEKHPEDKTNITGRTHYGDLQFLHCMAEKAGEDPYDTLAKVMLWAEFTYKLAISEASSTGAIGGSLLTDISITTTGKNTNTDFMLADYFKEGWDPNDKDTIRRLFLRDTQYKAPILVRRALGSLLHTIQDSYAIGHTKRELLNPEDQLPGTKYKFKKDTYGKFGAIMNFHSYAGQGAEHGKWDIVGVAGMDSRNLDSFNRIPGGRNAIDHSIQMINFWVNKTPWESGPKEYLETKVFVVHKDATPAVSKID